MEEQKPLKKKLLFTGVATTCLFIGQYLSRTLASKLDQGETLAGNDDLGLTLSFLVALLLSGLVSGQIGLIRGEKPVIFPVLALLLNGVIFIAVIFQLPR